MSSKWHYWNMQLFLKCLTVSDFKVYLKGILASFCSLLSIFLCILFSMLCAEKLCEINPYLIYWGLRQSWPMGKRQMVCGGRRFVMLEANSDSECEEVRARMLTLWLVGIKQSLYLIGQLFNCWVLIGWLHDIWDTFGWKCGLALTVGWMMSACKNIKEGRNEQMKNVIPNW